MFNHCVELLARTLGHAWTISTTAEGPPGRVFNCDKWKWGKEKFKFQRQGLNNWIKGSLGLSSLLSSLPWSFLTPSLSWESSLAWLIRTLMSHTPYATSLLSSKASEAVHTTWPPIHWTKLPVIPEYVFDNHGHLSGQWSQLSHHLKISSWVCYSLGRSHLRERVWCVESHADCVTHLVAEVTSPLISVSHPER